MVTVDSNMSSSPFGNATVTFCPERVVIQVRGTYVNTVLSVSGRNFTTQIFLNDWSAIDLDLSNTYFKLNYMSTDD